MEPIRRRSSYAMSMSVVSNSSPLAIRKDHDSVENEKDSALPTKKLKVDKDGLIHKTDSVTSLSDRDIFDMWCKYFRVTYKDEEEELYRFGIFQKSIKLDKTEDDLLPNYPIVADHTEEELKVCCHRYISKSMVDEMRKYAAYLARCSAPGPYAADDDEWPEV